MKLLDRTVSLQNFFKNVLHSAIPPIIRIIQSFLRTRLLTSLDSLEIDFGIFQVFIEEKGNTGSHYMQMIFYTFQIRLPTCTA